MSKFIYLIILLNGISIFCSLSYAEPQISLDAAMAPLFDISSNLNHGMITDCGYKHVSTNTAQCSSSSHPYGAWVDGPMNPYKFNGDSYFQIPHSENFRIKVPNHNWGIRSSWTMEGAFAKGAPLYPKQRNTVEANYNNRNWIFSVYSHNNILYGVTHHEWYRKNQTINSIPGFNLLETPWIATIGWLASYDGGQSWNMKNTSDSSNRVIVVPEPSAWNSSVATYGFMHPSNIVKEGLYYYMFSSTFNYSRDTVLQKNGVALFRTQNISKPTGWQFWSGRDWQSINHKTYQGNFGPQMPYVFWSKNNACSHLNAMNVRKHKNGKWITLGSQYCLPAPVAGQEYQYQAVFSWTNSLANPINLEKNIRKVNQKGLSILSNYYYSFFNVDGTTDDNYQSIGDHPLLVVTKNQQAYYHQFLTLTGF